MNKKAHIVIGLGFGDEGKGVTTSYLSHLFPNSIVCRFNGTAQAGHTVVVGDKRHVFSHFGAGTLQGLPTYWSSFCPVHPMNFYNEREALVRLGVNPRIIIDNDCEIITPYDMLANRLDPQNRNHGTVGLGFGKTIERVEAGLSLKISSQNLSIIEIRDYYQNKYPEIFTDELLTDYTDMFGEFWFRLDYLLKHSERKYQHGVNREFDNFIFEGAQGIMLDQNYGYFPNVTRSNTTSENALSLLNKHFDEINVYYVTRAYATRHGAGYFPNEVRVGLLDLVNTENETNVYNEFQSDFRYGDLSGYDINFALERDAEVQKRSGFYDKIKIKLVTTCLDQTRGKVFIYPARLDHDDFNHYVQENLAQKDKKFSGFLGCYGPSHKDMKDVL